MSQRALDLAVGDVERPQLVPALGVVAEEAHRRRLPALLQGVEPRPVGGQPGMLGIEPAHEFAHQRGIVAAGHQPEAGELRLPEALEQPAFDQQLQVPRHPGLALPQHMHVVADRQILARRQSENAQPRILRRRPQQGEQGCHGSMI